jgi:beta-glucanase (GH16 family)
MEEKEMRKFTKIMVGVLSLSMMLGTIGGIGKPAMIVKADDTRQLVWSDEFNGTTLDPNTWNYDTGTGSGGWGNNEQEYYTNLPSNVSVSNGSLNITAIKQSYDGSNYTSGRINTQGKQEFKYGTIEARIKMPAGNGLWPAFWMLGANIGEVSWPRCGETDIMETIDGQSNVYGTVHWNASTGTAQLGSNATNIDVTQWHVYQIDWNPTSIVWSVDGVQYYSVNIGAGSDNMAAFQNKQFMVLNLAVGGNWPGNTIDDSKMPATMSVDYVRVYQTPEEAVGDYGTIQTDDSTNLLKNPNFKYGTQGWTTYVGDSWIPCSAYFDTTDPSVPNGMSLIMHNIGGWLETDSQWAIQLYQDGIPLQAGQSYSLKYQIHSNKDKNVSVYVTDEDTGATYYSGTYKINAYQTENMMVNLASIPNNITNAKVCFAVGAQGDDLATNSCDLSITQLKLLPAISVL